MLKKSDLTMKKIFSPFVSIALNTTARTLAKAKFTGLPKDWGPSSMMG
ncbi:MAG: hypothetical protein L6V93_08240 [Clostridiales bacterium]|nr:MAG: hypothetical protein L6V93_08240 [Clostridiales bacterium]